MRPGQVVIDCGAHSGRHTFSLCEKVGAAGRVYAIEPVPSLAAHLKANTLPQLRVIEAAVTDFQGQTNLYCWKGEEALSTIRPSVLPPEGELDVITVVTRTLDGIVLEDETVRFLNVGLDGTEVDAMRGARRILEKDRPLVVFEHGHVESASYHKYAVSEFRDFWDDLGYVVVDLFGRPRQGMQFEDVSALRITTLWSWSITYKSRTYQQRSNSREPTADLAGGQRFPPRSIAARAQAGAYGVSLSRKSCARVWHRHRNC